MHCIFAVPGFGWLQIEVPVEFGGKGHMAVLTVDVDDFKVDHRSDQCRLLLQCSASEGQMYCHIGQNSHLYYTIRSLSGERAVEKTSATLNKLFTPNRKNAV